MKKHILFLLFLISAYCLNAQNSDPYRNIIPPNPDAASLAKYADYPVDLSTGVPQINIPLWNIKCGDINIPISLSYHASGIPVAETPSNVGLGWALNAGGAITRTIRGIADDGMITQSGATISSAPGLLTEGSYYAIYPNYPNNSDDYDNPHKYREAAVGKRDLEPDMFYYNFCNQSGKFVFDFNGTPHCIPRKNIKIEKSQNPIPNGRIVKWKITTEDGLKYYFDEVETTNQKTITEARLNNAASLKIGSLISNSLITSTHNSAWFLTKIEMPNSSQSVVFEYDDISIENAYPVSETYKEFLECHGEPRYAQKGIHEETITTATIQGKRLRKIITPNQTIEFIAGEYRHDLKGDKVLDKIVIKNNLNQITKQFKLSYNYFSENGMITVGTTANANTEANTKLRLSLKSIQELDKNNQSLPAHTFEYEENAWLPDRLTSKAQDHWGYYNGQINNTTLIPNLNSTINLHSIRDASEVTMKAGSLVKITYPTGGYTQFNYEANYVSSSASFMTGSGLRIKEKIDYDPVSKSSVFKNYDYNSSGYIGYVLNYVYQTVIENETYTNHTSSSNSALNNGEGSVVNYTKVTVTEGNDVVGINGKTENEYTILQSDNTYPVQNYSQSNKINLILYTRSTGQFPFAPAISGAWGSGLLKSQTMYKYKNSSYSKVKEIQNTYKNDYWGRTDVYNRETDVLAAKVGVVSSCSNCFGTDEFGTGSVNVQFYYIPSRNINLTETVETDYDNNGSPTTSKDTKIEYDNFSHYIYPSKTTNTQSDGRSLVKQTLYPQDYTNTGDDFIGLMKTNHILNKPIETITYKSGDGNTFITSGEVFTYKVGDNIGRPDKVYKLHTETPISKSNFKLSNKTTTNALLSNEGTNTSFSLTGIDSRYTNQPEITCNYDDGIGNPLQVTTRYGVTSYLWSYNNTYPIAKIENATYDQVSNAIPNISNITNSAYPDDAELYSMSNSLRNGLPNALVTTYTYKPMVGITTQIDPKGITTKYEYDDFGRLKSIRNNDEKTLQSFNYHYRNEQTSSSSTSGSSLSTSINSLNVTAAGTQTTFTIESNTSWSISNSNSWIIVGPTQGTGNASIYCVINPNTSSIPRSGVFTISTSGGIVKIIVVNQSGI